MAGERSLDLAKLDAEASQFHLVVEPPQELERSVAAPANPVAGSVEPLAESPMPATNRSAVAPGRFR